MNLSRMFAHALVRRIVYVLVAVLLAWIGVGEVRAQTGMTQEEAYTACQEYLAERQIAEPDSQLRCQHYAETKAYNFEKFSTIWEVWEIQAQFHYYGCPPPSEWNEETHTCHDPDECLAHNEEAGFKNVGPILRPYEASCVGGCEWKMTGPRTCATLGDFTSCHGEFIFTGEACPPDSPTEPEGPPEKPPEQCTATEGGNQFCKQADGEECLTAPSGAKICWGVGETGHKDSGPDHQERGPGSETPENSHPPTPPETTGPATGTTTTTTTVTDGGGGSYTVIITTTNYRNTNNTCAGPQCRDDSENNDEGDGEDEEGDDEASGGTGCDDPPIVFGDPGIGMVATQAWATRCAVEAGNTVAVTGDVSNCNEPFSVQGAATDENVQKLRAMRAEICPGENQGAASGDGNAIDWSPIDGPDDGSESGFAVDGEAIGADGLDDVGLGFSRSCPVMPSIDVFGQTIQFDNSVMCEWLALGGQILLVLAALLSVRILASGGV